MRISRPASAIGSHCGGLHERSIVNTWHWQRVENPWQEPENTTVVFALNAWRGYLYLGTRNLHNGGEVLRSADGIYWHSIAAQGFGDAANRDIYGFVGFRTCSTPARTTPSAATTTRSPIAAPRFGAAPAGPIGSPWARMVLAGPICSACYTRILLRIMD